MNIKPCHRLLLAYFCLMLIGLAPIWLTRYLPVQDYPNHLARVHVINNLHDDTMLQKFYSIEFAVLPVLTFDICVSLFNKVFPIDIAGRLFVSLVVFLLVSGVVFLNYVINRKISLYPLLAFYFLYSQAFMKGFFNFLFGVALFLWMTALWLILRDREIWKKIVFALLAVTVLFFSHLTAVALFLLAVFSFELYQFVVKYRFDIKAYACMIVPLMILAVLPILLFLMGPTSGTTSGIEYNPLINIITKNVLRLSSGVERNFDLFILLLTALSFIAGLVFRFFTIRKEFVPGLAALILFYIVMPGKIMSSINSDWRLLLPVVFFLLSITSTNEKHKMIQSALFSILVFGFVAQSVLVFNDWGRMQIRYSSVVHSVDKMQKGAKLFTVIIYDSYVHEAVPLMHSPCLAIIRKSAFVPTVFAIPSQQVLHLTPEYANIARQSDNACYTLESVPEINWSFILNEYDYVLVEGVKRPSGIPYDSLQSVFNEASAELFRINQNQVP